ncbi:hypothetical protein CALVIDRAFT_74517 [Calocera viscosa TUFC12733]|uniref:Uncharacterized protein n=1 Tax=Calocera viscosa (strain TUFC12733) TaxID=1330018 RepID=A0A167NCP1_CALVF|nr:hypothetical protein CALVIDRAFT_74517 [Calocera viscosa TUFC12733]
MSPLKMLASVKQTAYMFFLFNAVRFFSILTLLLVFSSNILVLYQDITAIREAASDSSSTVSSNSTSSAADDMVECDYLDYSTVPNQPAGAFWAILNRLFILFQCIIILWSELGFWEGVLKEYMPILGPDFGVWTIGAMQCMISAVVLSHHVDEFPLVSAFFLFSVGCLNIIIGLIFRAKMKQERILFNFLGKTKSTIKSGTTSLLPKFGNDDDDDSAKRFSQGVKKPAFLSGVRGKISRPMPNSLSETHNGGYGFTDPKPQDPKPWGFGWQGQKVAEYNGAIISEPASTLPKYAGSPPGSPTGQKAAIGAPWTYKSDHMI